MFSGFTINLLFRAKGLQISKTPCRNPINFVRFNTMKLIVGLGNPLPKYENTRHNVGFILLDALSDKLNLSWEVTPKFDAEMCVRENFILAKPQTYMNDSGNGVSKIINYYKIQPQDLLVVHDDVDLSLGTVREQFAAGSAGHHGVESIIDSLGTQTFWRLRVGIGRPTDANLPIDVFVLNDFGLDELVEVREKSGALDRLGEFLK